MKSLVVYATTHGCSHKAANEIVEKMPGEVTVTNVDKASELNLWDYDQIILGCSIHAGRIQKDMTHFYQKHMDVLLTKSLGLYLCCMYEGEVRQTQFEDAFPQELREHASASGLFGGELSLEKMNFFEKAIVKKVEGITESVSKLNRQAIEDFAKSMGAK